MNTEGICMSQGLDTTPFFIACRSGHCEIVRLLAADPRTDITWCGANGVTALYAACEEGHLDVRMHRILLSCTPLRDCSDDVCPAVLHFVVVSPVPPPLPPHHHTNPSTPLRGCCVPPPRPPSQVVTFLVDETRARTHLEQSIDGFTPLLIACAKGHLEVRELTITTTPM